MESILLMLLSLWVIGWAAYCVVGIAGVAPDGLDPAQLVAVGLGLTLLAGLYLLYRLVRARYEEADYSPGDHVVYLMQKYSPRPGRRAEAVHPIRGGEGYHYLVRKPWTVVEVVDARTLRVRTPGGKEHLVRADDPKLHKAGLLESLMLRLRWHKEFPDLPAGA